MHSVPPFTLPFAERGLPEPKRQVYVPGVSDKARQFADQVEGLNQAAHRGPEQALHVLAPPQTGKTLFMDAAEHELRCRRWNVVRIDLSELVNPKINRKSSLWALQQAVAEQLHEPFSSHKPFGQQIEEVLRQERRVAFYVEGASAHAAAWESNLGLFSQMRVLVEASRRNHTQFTTGWVGSFHGSHFQNPATASVLYGDTFDPTVTIEHDALVTTILDGVPDRDVKTAKRLVEITNGNLAQIAFLGNRIQNWIEHTRNVSPIDFFEREYPALVKSTRDWPKPKCLEEIMFMAIPDYRAFGNSPFVGLMDDRFGQLASTVLNSGITRVTRRTEDTAQYLQAAGLVRPSASSSTAIEPSSQFVADTVGPLLLQHGFRPTSAIER